MEGSLSSESLGENKLYVRSPIFLPSLSYVTPRDYCVKNPSEQKQKRRWPQKRKKNLKWLNKKSFITFPRQSLPFILFYFSSVFIIRRPGRAGGGKCNSAALLGKVRVNLWPFSGAPTTRAARQRAPDNLIASQSRQQSNAPCGRDVSATSAPINKF